MNYLKYLDQVIDRIQKLRVNHMTKLENQKQFLIILIFYHIYVLIGKLFNSLRKKLY